MLNINSHIIVSLLAKIQINPQLSVSHRYDKYN